MEFIPHDPDSIYFTFEAFSVLKSQFFIILLYYLTLKLGHLAFYLVRDKCAFFQFVYRILRDQTKWWTLAVACVELNIYWYSYSTGLQFLSNSHQDVFDKANSIYCMLTFFVALCYSLAFYPLIYTFESQNGAYILLARCSYSFAGFLLEPILVFGRSLIKSFVHGFLTQQYDCQIVVLALLDIAFVLLCWRMRKCFRSFSIFVSTLLYCALFLVFDVFFVVENANKSLFADTRKLFGLVVCASLAILSILIGVCIIVIGIAEFCQ